jgi:plastocyanin
MMGRAGPSGADSGSPGFIAGTPASPRVVRIAAGPGYRFYPSTVTVAAGETVTFVVTAMGPLAHEFKVGRIDVVQADGDAPEIADIGMMQTKTLIYTFAGPGPFGYACHEAGHYESGMQGTIVVV